MASVALPGIESGAIPGKHPSISCFKGRLFSSSCTTPTIAAVAFTQSTRFDCSLRCKSEFLGGQLHHRNSLVLRESRSSANVVVARLFGPAIFEASKLKVLFLGDGKDKRPDELPRAYTLTHSDITSKITLAVSQTINKAQIQGWYSRLQRDEVLAEWQKSQGHMSLHVHCHISGGHWLLDVIAHLRFYIFRKELPVVLEAFRYGDVTLFKNHPELEEALVWVYFHSNEKKYNRVECWGPLRQAAKGCAASEEARKAIHNAVDEIKEHESSLMSKRPMQSPEPMMLNHQLASTRADDDDGRWKMPVRCAHPCKCCFPPLSVIPLPHSFEDSNWTERERQQA